MKFLFLLLYLFCCATLVAQNQMQPVTITDNNNNTLQGFAKYTLNAKLCAGIVYSNTATAKAANFKKLTAKELKMVHFTTLNRKFYQKEIFGLSKDDEKQYYVDSSKTDTVLIELLVAMEGTRLFFYQTSHGKKRFFVENKAVGFRELEEKITTIRKNGSSYQHRNKKFVGILKTIFSDCSKLNDIYFSKRTLTIQSLAKVFFDYAACQSIALKHTSPITKEKASASIVVGTGVSYAVTTFSKVNNINVENYLPNPQGVISVPAYVGVLLYPPNLQNTIFLGTGIYYTRKGATSNHRNAKFNLHYLGFNINVGYQVPFGKVRPFFGPEFTYSALLNPSNAFTRDLPPNNISNKTTQYLFYQPGAYNNDAQELAVGGFLGLDIALAKQYHTRVLLKYLYGRYTSLTYFYGNHYLECQVQFRLNFKKKQK